VPDYIIKLCDLPYSGYVISLTVLERISCYSFSLFMGGNHEQFVSGEAPVCMKIGASLWLLTIPRNNFA